MPIAVLTGDIIGSTNHPPHEWLPELKKALNEWGHSPVDWELFRGDSFQLACAPDRVLDAFIRIKAHMLAYSPVSIRAGMGIGEVSYRDKQLSASNGSAFVRSGRAFDGLKRQRIALITDDPERDALFAATFPLISWLSDQWKTVTAQIVCESLRHPELSQKDLAKRLGKTQGGISRSLQRAGYDELTAALHFYRQRL